MSKRTYIFAVLLINGVIPWALYVWLSHHLSSIAALSIATLVPLADNLYQLGKHRKLDAFGSLMLFTFVLTLILVLFGGSEKIILIRESLITAAVGVIFLCSLLSKRPLMFYLALRFLGKSDFSENWVYPYFRYVMRLMTLVWGMLLVIEAATRITMVFKLSTAQYLALSNVVLYGYIGAAVVWTVLYRKHSARRLREIKRNTQKGFGFYEFCEAGQQL